MSSPWESGPAELLLHAIEHWREATEFDQRVAFLLCDVAVETTLRTFLEYAASNLTTSLEWKKRKEGIGGTFHDLITVSLEAAGKLLESLDPNEVLYFHKLRNQLYHNGNGIAVEATKTEKYLSLAAYLLSQLLGPDLAGELAAREREEKRREEGEAVKREAERVAREVRSAVTEFERVILEVLEGIEAGLALPSFDRAGSAWLERCQRDYLAQKASQGMTATVDESRRSGPMRLDRSQCMRAVGAMPAPLRRVLHRVSDRERVVQRMAFCSHIEELRVVAVEIAINREDLPIADTYTNAEFHHALLSQPDGPDYEGLIAEGRTHLELLAIIRQQLQRYITPL